MVRGRYIAVSVPIELHDDIKKYIEHSNFSNIAEFVKYCIRKQLEIKPCSLE